MRTYELLGKKVKEGIYSPITQNERHMRVLKEIRKDSKSNIVSKQLFEKNFSNVYKSLVVLANPKMYLNAKFAGKEVKNQVIRADQLITYMKKVHESMGTADWSEKEMRELAEFYLSKNQPKKSDYSKRYEEVVAELEAQSIKQEIVQPVKEKQVESKIEPVGKSNVESDKKLEVRFEETKERPCPKCGSTLIVRTSKKGHNVGSQFWGCSNFPKCRHTEK